MLSKQKKNWQMALMSARTQQEIQIDNSVRAIFLKRKVKYNVQKLEMASWRNVRLK